jgi:CrcB protein
VTALLVLIGGAVGAPTRYWVDLRFRGRLAWGIFAVNVVGSFILGGLASASVHGHLASWVYTLCGTGFCGALTTFSTFSLDTVRLWEDGRSRAALLNVLATVSVGLAACALAWWAVATLS